MLANHKSIRIKKIRIIQFINFLSTQIKKIDLFFTINLLFNLEVTISRYSMSVCVEKSQNCEYRLVQSGHGFNLEIVEKITIYAYSHKFLGQLNIEGWKILEKK